MGPRVIVTVVRGEHHAVCDAEGIKTGVTRVPGHTKGVAGLLPLFRLHPEPTVLGVVPAEIGSCLQVKSQLVAALRGQLTE